MNRERNLAEYAELLSLLPNSQNGSGKKAATEMNVRIVQERQTVFGIGNIENIPKGLHI
jgi:hypothetical protein